MSQPSDLRVELAALFAEMRAEIDRREQSALALLGAVVDRGETPAPAAEREWASCWAALDDARRLLRCSRVTAITKIKQHGLGHIVDRRWRVDLNRVDAYLGKQSFPPLPNVD